MSNRQLVHITRMPIHWTDMDAMGHVSNSIYFRYMDHARISWLTAIDCTPTPKGEGPVVLNVHCTFLRQLEYPGDLEIRTFIKTLGNTSFEVINEIRRADTPEILAAEGGAKLVWVDFPKQKSVPLSDALRRRLTTPSLI